MIGTEMTWTLKLSETRRIGASCLIWRSGRCGSCSRLPKPHSHETRPPANVYSTAARVASSHSASLQLRRQLRQTVRVLRSFSILYRDDVIATASEQDLSASCVPLAADDLVKKDRDFGGGVESEADPRRCPEAHSRMQSAARTKAPARRPETATSFHSSEEEPTACFTFGHVFPYGRSPEFRRASSLSALGAYVPSYRKSPMQFILNC